MNTLLIAVSLFIPSSFGGEEVEDEVPDICLDLVDGGAETVEVWDNVIDFLPSKTVNKCETILVKDEAKSLSESLKSVTEDKESLREKLTSKQKEKEELDAIIKAQKAQIKEAQDHLKEIQEEFRIELEQERKATEDAQAKKAEENRLAAIKQEEERLASIKQEEEDARLATLAESKSNEESPPDEVATVKEEPQPQPSQAVSGGETFEVTYYTAFCDTGCTGVTADGTDVSNTTTHNGHGIIATDPSVIPLGTVVTINGATYIAKDTGGDIKGNRIDILVSSKSEARSKGRHNVQVQY